MSLSDLSFKFYDDAGLTTLTTTLIPLAHKTDLSDNPQTLHKYLGSNAIGTELQTQTSPGSGNITLTPTRILQVFTVSTAVIVGQRFRPTFDNNWVYVVTTDGTTAGTEPTWSLGLGSYTTSGTAIFQAISAEHPVSEIKLALTEAGLASATGGAALSLGPTIDSGVANLVNVWIRVANTITTVGNSTGYAELGININAVQEV